jgi:hypothetical protein
MISPTARRGFSEAKGSWKIICRRRRSGRSSRRDWPTSSCPSKRTLPPLAGSSCRIALPTVVLPQPDSPTSASVRPRASSSETPSTART